MPKKSKTLHANFTKKLKALNITRKNFESAFNSSSIKTEDICQAYAGLYLDMFTEFENLIEKLFIGLLIGTVKHENSAVRRKIHIKPVTLVESVLLGSKKSYLEWLPYQDNTIEKAKIYFIDGKPFSILTSVQKDKVANYHKIRNAIAHKSKKAKEDFNNIIAVLTLLPQERTPQGYLRSIPNRATGKTQLEIVSEELEHISHDLCN